MKAIVYMGSILSIIVGIGTASAKEPVIERFFFNKKVEETAWVVIGAAINRNSKRCDALKKLENGDIIVFSIGSATGDALELGVSSPRWSFGRYGAGSEEFEVTVSFKDAPNKDDGKPLTAPAFAISPNMLLIQRVENRLKDKATKTRAFRNGELIRYIGNGMGPDIVISTDVYTTMFSLSGYQKVIPILDECMKASHI